MGITSVSKIDERDKEPFGQGLVNAETVHSGNCCKFCGSQHLIRWGKQNGEQRWKCKDCNHTFQMNGKFPRMQTDYRVVSAALEWYYSGFSLKKVVWQLKRIFGVRVVRSAVLYWIEKFVPRVKEFVSKFKAPGSGLWHVDETCVKAGGEIDWYWEVMDRETKYIHSTNYTHSRTTKVARKLFKDAWRSSGEKPVLITCDKLPAYERAVHGVFGYWTGTTNGKVGFLHGKGPGTNPSNVWIERFHNTLKERTKVMRGVQSIKTGRAILDGFVIFYNWLRPHETLQERTPAQASGINLDLDGGFADLIQYSIIGGC